MKIRAGFVSNSSSSSFTCDVCNETHSGWDASLKDAEMYECENGHTFCRCHSDIGEDHVSPEFLKRHIERGQKWNPELWELVKDLPLEKVIEAVEEHDEDYLADVAGEQEYCIPAELCPCCKFKELSDRDALRFLLVNAGFSKKSLIGELLKKFSSYEEFEKFVSEKKENQE